MATSVPKLTFHFDESTAPTKIMQMLRALLYAEEPITTLSKLELLTQEQDGNGSNFQHTTKFVRGDLDLIRSSPTSLCLTPDAHVLLKKRENVQHDILHFLFYSRWNEQNCESNARSWFYNTVCDKLWYMQDVVFDNSILLSLLQEVEEEIRVTFAHFPDLAEKLSIGMRTMRGVRAWLRDVIPPVLEVSGNGRDRFRRRVTCSAELFLLALSHCYQRGDIEVGVDVLLSAQRRDEICRLCLLDPLQFDRMVDWILPIYPQFINQGTRTGTYGRFIRLQRFVTLTDLS